MNSEKEFKFKLGSKVKDKIDGFTGIVFIQMRHLTGCLQYAVVSNISNNNGDRIGRYWIDESLLELCDE